MDYVGPLNNIANVLGFHISDNAGIADICDYRIHRHIRKPASRRETNSDYVGRRSEIQPDIRAAVTRDVEAAAEATRRAKEKEKATKEKGKEKNY